MGGGIRRDDLGAVLPQVRRKSPGRDGGNASYQPAGQYGRQYGRRDGTPSGRGDEAADGRVGQLASAGLTRKVRAELMTKNAAGSHQKSGGASSSVSYRPSI